jgi:hypothetical protein
VRHQEKFKRPKTARDSDLDWSHYGLIKGTDALLRPFIGFFPSNIRHFRLRRRFVSDTASDRSCERYLDYKGPVWDLSETPVVVYSRAMSSVSFTRVTFAMIYGATSAGNLIDMRKRNGCPSRAQVEQLYHLATDGLRLFVHDYVRLGMQWAAVDLHDKFIYVPSKVGAGPAPGVILPPWIASVGSANNEDEFRQSLRAWLAGVRNRVDLYRSDTHEEWAAVWVEATLEFLTLLEDPDADLETCVEKLWPVPTLRSALLAAAEAGKQASV